MSPPDGYQPGTGRTSSGYGNAADTPLEVTGPHFSDVELPDGAPKSLIQKFLHNIKFLPADE
jgi:hypothetical protein